MSWLDTFGLVHAALSASPRPQQYAPLQTSGSFGGASSWARVFRDDGQKVTNWQDLASGRLAGTQPVAPRVPGAAPNTRPQAGVPERFSANYPYSSTGPRSPYAPAPVSQPASTKGDFGASLGAAFGATGLNFGNAIPWLMERVNTAANDLADTPVIGGVLKDAWAPATDLFLHAVQAAAGPAASVLDAFPTYVRDGQMFDRAKIYRAYTTGDFEHLYGDLPLSGPVGSPINSILQLTHDLTPVGAIEDWMAGGSIFDTSPTAIRAMYSVSAEYNQAKQWHDLLLHSIDPQQRMDATQRLLALRDTLDIPESVKLQLEQKPGASDDEIRKWMDQAPEGKAWSYHPDLGGALSNIANPLLFYAAEARTGLQAAGSASAFGTRLAAGEGASAALGQGIGLAGRGLSLAARVQTGMVSAGLGIGGVSTVMDAVARYQGNEAAIKWWDHALRTTPFSDDPNVQLVTSFSVNPFKAAGVSKATSFALKHGLFDVPLNKLTRGKMLTYYNQTSVMEGMVARMFKLGSREEAATFLDEQGLRDQAHDMVLGTALDTVLDRLPKEDRQAFVTLHPDPVERAAATLRQYAGQAFDLIEKDPEAVAARFHQTDWNYRMMPGPFNAEVAAAIARDYRRAMNRTYDLRQEQNLVVGYREYLPPQGQSLARAQVEAATVDGRVPVKAIQQLVGDFPALRKHWGGIPFDQATISRAQADRIVDRAAMDWATAAKVNPVRVATGHDPVLRRDSPTPMRDYAEALGTTQDTVDAVWNLDPKNAGKVELLKQYLVDHAGMDRASVDGMSAEDVTLRASDHIAARVEPWEAMGARVSQAEKQMTVLRGELARVRREGGREMSDRTVRLQRQINELQTLVSTASDPAVPFAAEARQALPDAHLREAAARKVDALDRLRTLKEVDDQLAAAGLRAQDLDLVVTGADGELAWAHDIREAPPQDVVDAFLAYRTANMKVGKRGRDAMGGKTFERQLTRRGEDFQRGIEEAPGAMQWTSIADSPGFLKRMREIGDGPATGSTHHVDPLTGLETATMTGNQVADALEAQSIVRGTTGRTLGDVAAEMGVEPAQALERLAEMKRARETALDGKGPAVLKRTAGLKVPDDYVAQAELDAAARSLVYDAEYDAFWHPRNVAKVQEITSRPDELYPGLRVVVEGDAELEDGIARVASRLGITPDDVLSDSAHADAVRAELVPAGFEPPIEGMVREFTDLDFLIRSGDQDAVAALAQKASERAQRPAQQIPERIAKRLAGMPKNRRSYQYRRSLSDAGGDFARAPSEAILSAAENRLGVDVLSFLNHGILGTKPATLDGVIALLKTIEDGDATRAGVGPEMQAEAQRVARKLLDDAVRQAKTDPNLVGTFGAGFFPEDEQALAASIDDMLSFDRADPLGTLQYGLKKAPTSAVVMEWSQVPGLAEEFFTKRFQPWEERVGTTKARQAFNYVFGPRSNQAIRLQTKNRFVEGLSAKGIQPSTAEAIWNRWAEISHDSRRSILRRLPTGERTYVQGDNPLYADIWNIPNHRLNDSVVGAQGRSDAGVLAKLNGSRETAISNEELAIAKTIDFAKEFRLASSGIRRTLEKGGPLGRHIADAYGMVAHNEAATTLYYWFRFGLDVRYHAMNYLEAQILYAGRAGLRRGEIDTGLLGQTEGYLRNLDADPITNTGYQFSRDRMAYAYKTFLKEQPDALRGALKGMASEDPAVMRKAMRELAASDPQLRDMIDAMGDQPERYLSELDAWHKKMLDNVDGTEDARVIDDALAQEMRDTPALQEVFGRLGQVNKQLWDDVRETFYGNPDRSRAERFLNSYLLFWPLSYQIKSTKWFAKVLFDRAGGLPTNALGAVTLDRLADTHNRLLSTDPEYRDWFEKHRTLTFVGQMLFPVSFDSTGVSLNPILRSMFFERTKAAMEVGPIYTYNKVIQPLGREAYADLYPWLGDLPMFDGLWRAATGTDTPKPKP